MLVFGVPAAVVFLLVRTSDLRKQIKTLETRLDRLDRAPVPRAAPAAPAPAEPETAAPPSEVPAEAPPPRSEPRPESAEPGASQPPTERPPAVRAPAPPAAAAAAPPRYVFTGAQAGRFGGWLRENWFFAVAAISLALAGVFLVQYGIEQGLLTPWMRVIGAVALGVVLVGAGEWVRRRKGEDMSLMAATFAGAGVVSVYAGILAARQLYGLIGAEAAFVGLAAAGLGALLVGWFHGALVSSVGILGAMITPFMVGGAAEEPYWLYGYFAAVLAVALGVDAAKRWAWVSALALILGFGSAALLYMGEEGGAYYLAFGLFATAAAAAIPTWSLTPAHGGVTVSESLYRWFRLRPVWPDFPVRLVAASAAATVAIAWAVMTDDALTFWSAAAALGLLFAMGAVWFRHAPALADVAAAAGLGFAALIIGAAWYDAGLYLDFVLWVPPEAEIAPPRTVSVLVAGALAASALASWRSLAGPGQGVFWTVLAALIAPAAITLFEIFWAPARIIGDYAWALHAVAAAVLLTALAGRHGAVAEHRHLRVAILAMLALTMLSLALVVMFTKAALTVALALMVLLAVLLDRRFDLRALWPFVQIGVATALFRLTIDPGLVWALDAPIQSVLFAYLGVMALFFAAREAAAERVRESWRVSLEAAVWVAGAVLASALISRGVESWAGSRYILSYWQVSLQAMVWIVTAFGMLRRYGAGGGLVRIWLVLAGLAGALGALLLLVATVPLSPLVDRSPVLGPWIFDTLLLAYGVPAAVLLAGQRALMRPGRWPGRVLLAVAVGLAALNIALEIRHLWRGDDLWVAGVTDPELYTYSLAMLVVSAGLMLAAWLRRAPALRLLGIGAVALTVAKVFLIDMAGLTGLMRVGSFLALGLALAGLAQLNRWMIGAGPEPEAGPEEEPGA